ncbi:hypothetical protein L1887_28970 [Cichorium endivia]|nr:hypothetical protein L1887_28970 [Cichorium endivia]
MRFCCFDRRAFRILSSRIDGSGGGCTLSSSNVDAVTGRSDRDFIVLLLQLYDTTGLCFSCHCYRHSQFVLGLEFVLATGNDELNKNTISTHRQQKKEYMYVDLKPCISRLPEDGSGANITKWPERLNNPPERLQNIKLDAYMSRKDLFKAESKYWKEIINSYVHALRWNTYKLRNVMDMRADYGGFAVALIGNQLDCWVMNVVPVSGPNALPVIYDRGLLGVMHDWCESFDTYPRICNITSIMLEMDRILRPGGRAYIFDSVSIIKELEEIGKVIGWHVEVRDTAEGPHAKLLKAGLASWDIGMSQQLHSIE